MSDLDLPATRYAQSDNVNIAYQVMGEGPPDIMPDIVLVPGVISNIECHHELPGYTAALRRLASFARVIAFDKRGQGLSDRMVDAPSLEQRMDDVRAVMDAVGTQRAALMGFSEGSAMSVLFAATHPERVSHLVLVGGFSQARFLSDEAFERWIADVLKHWGDGRMVKLLASADRPVSEETLQRFGRLERQSTSPGALKAIWALNNRIDVRPILGSIQVPTLVLHRQTDRLVEVEAGRTLAARIPKARLIEYPDGDHAWWTGDSETLLADVQEFVTGRRDSEAGALDRVLATVLFTDIVDATGTAVALGDLKWRRLLDEHDRLGRALVERHRGTLVKTTGDGILATFDGPARAVRCALAFATAAAELGLTLRAGLHTGEVERRGGDIGGIAVHAAARVMAEAQAGEILVSRVVTDLVAGAGLKFSERGPHALKGLPGRWDLFAASL